MDETADPVLGDVQYMVAAVSQGTVGNYSDPSTTYNLNGLTIIDDSNPMVQYSGWSSWSESKHYGGSIHFVENSTGKETITTKFYGTEFRFIRRSITRWAIWISISTASWCRRICPCTMRPAPHKIWSMKKRIWENGLHTITVVGNGKANPGQRTEQSGI